MFIRAKRRTKPVQSIIDRVRIRMSKEGLGIRTLEARKWLASKVWQSRRVSKDAILNATLSKQVGSVQWGKMYFFTYDPKLKDSLPYYDTFPLILAVGPAKDGFYGVNLHYLPPMARAFLLSKLEALASNKSFNDKMKLKISYKILSSTAQYSEFRPCFKHYLNAHVTSPFVFIPPSEWEIAALLPSENFRKKTREYVWKQSGF